MLNEKTPISNRETWTFVCLSQLQRIRALIIVDTSTLSEAVFKSQSEGTLIAFLNTNTKTKLDIIKLGGTRAPTYNQKIHLQPPIPSMTQQKTTPTGLRRFQICQQVFGNWQYEIIEIYRSLICCIHDYRYNFFFL